MSSLPPFLSKTKKNVLYGKNVKMLSNRRTSSPMPSISFPDLSYRRSQFVNTQYIHKLINKLEQSPSIKKLVIGYSVLPGNSEYINHEFYISKQIKDRLKCLSNSLGLSCNRIPYSVPELFSYTRKGTGISGLVNEKFEKVLVEVITFMNGEYGRFLVLVSLGVSCTVWYVLAPGIEEIPPPTSVFPRLLHYDKFFNVDNHCDQFNKLCFLEQKYITGEVLSALENVFPFSEMDIPSNVPSNVNESNVNHNDSMNYRVAVGLGLMVAVLLAMGIVPNSSSINEIEQR
jgi:hypothetical protein